MTLFFGWTTFYCLLSSSFLPKLHVQQFCLYLLVLQWCSHLFSALWLFPSSHWANFNWRSLVFLRIPIILSLASSTTSWGRWDRAFSTGRTIESRGTVPGAGAKFSPFFNKEISSLLRSLLDKFLTSWSSLFENLDVHALQLIQVFCLILHLSISIALTLDAKSLSWRNQQ